MPRVAARSAATLGMGFESANIPNIIDYCLPFLDAIEILQ